MNKHSAQKDRGIVVPMAMVVALLVLLAGLVSESNGRDARRDERWRDTPNRFWAQLQNGQILIGRDLREWHHDKGAPRLDGKHLFDKNNPLRLLRDTTVRPQRYGPYIQFHNGDLIPGRVIAAGDAEPAKGLPEHLLLALMEPMIAFDKSSDIAVRPDAVARIVLQGQGNGPLEPGTLIFDDGRRVRIKAVRWARGGLRALTEDGFISAGWLEIAEVHLPVKDETRVNALFSDLTMPCPDPQSRVGRIVAESGAVLTYRQAMLKVDHERDKYFGQYHAVQPAWSFHAIRVPMDYIATRSYREHDQIPLSSLNAESLAQRSFTGFNWRWRRDRNVRDGELASENMMADMGIGMHAYSELAFDLPPHAKQFSTWVGIDNAVGSGGCVQCRIYRDEVSGKPAWQSGFLRGGAAPVKVGPLDLKDAKRLILVVDYGHDKRPRGADPLDIRDEVAWLFPMVHVDRDALPQNATIEELDEVIPQLAGWTLRHAESSPMEFHSYFSKSNGGWVQTMIRNPDGEHKADDVLFSIERKITVDVNHALLQVEAGRSKNEHEGHTLKVTVNGEPLGSFLNGDVHTNRSEGTFDTRLYPLGAFVGKEINVAVHVHPLRNGNYKLASLLWGRLGVMPVIEGLPESGAIIKPDVAITRLKPTKVEIKPPRKDDGNELKIGQTTKGEPLHIRHFPIADGYGVPPGSSSITYKLDPAWKQFVAVIGMCEGTYGAGPYDIMLDDKIVWTTGDLDKKSRKTGQFERTSPGRQVVLDIPPGHKTITLQVRKVSRSFAVWGYAGFTKE